MHSAPRRPESHHPDDVLWCSVQNDLDAVEPKAGPSYERDTLIDVSDGPVPLPRTRAPSSSQAPVPRPRSLRCSSPNDFVLVDVSPDRRTSPESNMVALLQKTVNGFAFIGKECVKTVQVLKEGTLLRPLTNRESAMRKHLEVERRQPSEMLFTDLQHRNVGVVVHPSLIMRITEDQSLLLLGVDVDERLDLHRDFERFHFVENVKVEDRVSVFTPENDGMYQGRVVWIGERPRELGTWFKVETNRPSPSMSVPDWDRPPPPRSIYANAAHIHKPLKNNNFEYRPAPPPVHHQPEVRNIPIRRVETHFDTDNGTTQTYRHYDNATGDNDSFARDLNTWDGDPKTVNDATREWRDRTREEKERRNGGTLRSKHSQNGTAQPSRSQSAHAVSASDRTYSVDDPVKTNGTRVGDRCIWTNSKNSGEHHYHKGTIRFIGYLKGHASLYAGVEFDDAVGRGTGVFQGETIFQAAENRAGFVVLGQLEILPRPSEANGGRHLAVKHKQASAESLSDPPAPPPVPPRPAMRPEDYMIDSFSIGSYVEVCHLGACRSGVVRWVGDAMSEDLDHLEKSAVVELDADVPSGWRPATHPTSNATPYLRGVLVPTTSLRRDRRVNGADDSLGVARQNGKTDFGSIDSGIETTRCEPWKMTEDLVGRMKGVQGHKNSCYIDATLYAMFVQSTAFDFLLERAPRKSDIPQYKELLRLLTTEIVYPLRKFHYVRADHVMKVRELLAEIMPTVKGLTSEEKDPEEILGLLFANVLKAEPFVQLMNMKDNKMDHIFLCPLVVEDWQGGVVTTQHLLERSMRAAGVKFATAPKNLILQLPRYGQQKLFDKILPLESIDITSLVNHAIQPCASCDKPADGMCPECFLCKRVFLQEVSHCNNCFRRVHFNAGEGDHVMRPFYPNAKPMKKISSHRMVLSAVLCIETSHYVAFVRAQTGRWLFFDSMADREGLSDGFNVPQVKECDKMPWWLSRAGWERLKEADQNGHIKTMLGKGSDVDPLVTRLLSDSYICFYQEEPSSPASSSNNLLNMLKIKF